MTTRCCSSAAELLTPQQHATSRLGANTPRLFARSLHRNNRVSSYSLWEFVEGNPTGVFQLSYRWCPDIGWTGGGGIARFTEPYSSIHHWIRAVRECVTNGFSLSFFSPSSSSTRVWYHMNWVWSLCRVLGCWISMIIKLPAGLLGQAVACPC